MAAALPETSPGAKTSFTRSYTVREPDHLEIYAFFNCMYIVSLMRKRVSRTSGILCVYPVQNAGIDTITCSLAYPCLNVNPHERRYPNRKPYPKYPSGRLISRPYFASEHFCRLHRARIHQRKSENSFAGRKRAQSSRRAHSFLWSAGTRQDHTRPSHRKRDRPRTQSNIRTCHRKGRRPRKHPHESSARRYSFCGRDPSPQ